MCSMTGPAPIRRSDALPADYPQFLAEVKAWIAAARTRAVLAVNSELIQLYWEIGHEILEREQREGWGAKVIDRLAADLRREFPEMTGLSLRNLKYMRAFALAWPVESPSSIVQQPAAQLPWAHNMVILDKLKDADDRFYLTAVDELERQAGDEPSIGLVLCPGRSKTVTEWALRGIDSPVAIARYTTSEVTLTQTPPPEMQPALPDLPALANELSNIVEAANAVYEGEPAGDAPGIA
jgi:predicted nuclease of restriction endonuclease-like (RecB) superfamily